MKTHTKRQLPETKVYVFQIKGKSAYFIEVYSTSVYTAKETYSQLTGIPMTEIMFHGTEETGQPYTWDC